MKRRELCVDIETYSSVKLKQVGVYPYAASPDFKMLMAAYAMGDEPVKVAVGEGAILTMLEPYLDDPSVVKIAHNAQFERVCFSRLLGLEPGEYLDPEQWHDTAAVAANRGLPRHLGKLAQALGGEQKDEAGTRLINMFCVPQARLGGRPYLPEEKPQEWEQFIEYCRQDVETHRDVHRRMGGWRTAREKRVFMADQRMNDRGIIVDLDMAAAAEEAGNEAAAEAGEELMSITGVTTPNGLQQIKAWMEEAASEEEMVAELVPDRATPFTPPPDFKAETIEEWLKKDLPNDVRRVLELRQELSLTAIKKYRVALDSQVAGRVRGQFLYHGAHTGRWSGRGIQLHNLPRHQFTKIVADPVTGKEKKEWDGETEAATRADVLLGLGATTDDLKRLVRSMLVGPFTVVDYAAIEARVIAWLAGEEWTLEAFRKGRDIYVETAERMSTPTKKLDRSQGKVAVLALGFAGGINSLKVMGASGGDAELKGLVYAWRDANPHIVEFWEEMGEAFRRGGKVGAFVEVLTDGTDRRIVLPSGRAIEYHGFKMLWQDTQYGRKAVPSFIDSGKGFRTRTYGGRLTENVVQGTARDVLADALVRLEERGFTPVGHVHDEILVEGGDLDEVKKIMTEVPDWAPDLPIDGEGFVTERYRKG